MTYEKGNLYQISIIDFKLDPDQPRKVIDQAGIEELVASIKKHGVLQPLLFRGGGQGWVIIVSGERRYLAAKQAGLLVLPAICCEGNYAEISLVENLQRQDLTVIEEAEALHRLKTEAQYSDEQLAVVVAKPRTTVGDSLALLRLPQDIRDDCRSDRKIAKSKLLEISRRKQERSMRTAYEQLKIRMQQDEEGGRKRGAAAAPSVRFCRSLDQARVRLEDTDKEPWTEEERTTARDAALALREAIDNYLDPPASSNLA